MRTCLSILIVFLFSFSGFAGSNIHHNDDPLLKTFIENIKRLPDEVYQSELRNQPAWKNFRNQHGMWYVTFNEENAKPHRAYGKPIPMSNSGDAVSTALNFINTHLKEFNVPVKELNLISNIRSAKYHQVHFNQVHDNLEVLFSRSSIKLTPAYEVVMYSLDVYNDIDISTNPSISLASANAFASAGVSDVTSIENGALKILPVPSYRKNVYHLVYEIMVKNRNADGIPAHYYTLVDANNGEILYRHNEVSHVAGSGGTTINASGTVLENGFLNPSSVEGLPYLKMTENGNTHYADDLGVFTLSLTGPVTGNFTLEGLYCEVFTSNAMPSMTQTINNGVANNLLFDNNANDRELNAYRHVNIVHDYMKSFFPTFTAMDNPMETNIDLTSGTCNAFYSGDLNFYAAGGGCNATALLWDVIYHEYGHGINSQYYNANGGSWSNGAMGEGYADVWGLGITEEPELGIGFFTNNSGIRRYDINPKVYPADLIGEVHADGEIIAGAWWDLGQNFGNTQQMMTLFASTYDALITGANGNEGQVFTDILLEALFQDDNDGNLNNGTPNIVDITSAFAAHGITLLTNADLVHTDVLASVQNAPIMIDATLSNVMFPWYLNAVVGYYQINGTGPWTQFTLNNTGGYNYQGSIPGQPQGTIVSYYLALEDINNALTQIRPGNANSADPNIPYYILVDFTQIQLEDFDNYQSFWMEGLASDDATTGQWLVDAPIASYLNNGGTPSGMVQPDYQHTNGGLLCAVTGNAGPGDPAGTDDIDGGKTTLVSPSFDLSQSTDPAFSYYRWYSNDQGATPGTDFWQVAVSGDGVNWVDVENTKVSDHSWRRFVFKPADYITLTSNVSVRFIGEDANDGSLVEALVDDFILYDALYTGIEDATTVYHLNAFPIPATNQVTLNWNQLNSDDLSLNITNQLGQLVFTESLKNVSVGEKKHLINTSSFDNGLYSINVISGKSTQSIKMSIIK